MITTEQKANLIRRALQVRSRPMIASTMTNATAIDLALISPCDLLAELTSSNKEEREHAKAAIRLLLKIGAAL